MALAETTVSSAVGASANSIVIAAATSMAAGRIIQVDGEKMIATKGYVTASTTVPVLRGVEGTAQAAHAASARVVHGDAADWAAAGAGTFGASSPGSRVRKVVSYSATGTMALPALNEDLVVVINTTSAVTLTVPVPTKDLDGCEITFVTSGVAAHVIDFTGGLSGAGSSYNAVTINSGAVVALKVIACNEVWVAPFAPGMTGTVTNLVGGVA